MKVGDILNTGEKIKLARKRAGLTQKELGEKLGITYQQIGQYENGKRQPKLETLNKIADALDADVWELYNGYELPIPRDTENIETMNKLMWNLNNPGQDKAIEQVELLTKIPEYQKKDE